MAERPRIGYDQIAGMGIKCFTRETEDMVIAALELSLDLDEWQRHSDLLERQGPGAVSPERVGSLWDRVRSGLRLFRGAWKDHLGCVR